MVFVCVCMCRVRSVKKSLCYSHTFQSRENVTRFSNFSCTPGDLICREQPNTNLAVLYGLWGAMCRLPELAVANWRSRCQLTYAHSAVVSNLKRCGDHSAFNTQCRQVCPARARRCRSSKYIPVKINNNVTWQCLATLWSAKAYYLWNLAVVVRRQREPGFWSVESFNGN